MECVKGWRGGVFIEGLLRVWCFHISNSPQPYGTKLIIFQFHKERAKAGPIAVSASWAGCSGRADSGGHALLTESRSGSCEMKGCEIALSLHQSSWDYHRSAASKTIILSPTENYFKKCDVFIVKPLGIGTRMPTAFTYLLSINWHCICQAFDTVKQMLDWTDGSYKDP